MTNKVIAVFSPVGGAGVTTVATHLAYRLAERESTAIVDFVVDFGSVSEFLGHAQESRLPKRQTLKVLSSPQDFPEKIDAVKVLDNCRKSFGVTVVDLPHSRLCPQVAPTLEQADHVLVVGQYDWSVILQIGNFFALKDAPLWRLAQKSKVIINKTEWLPRDVLEECHKNLGAPVFSELSYEAAFSGCRKLQKGSGNWRNSIKRLAEEVRKP